MTATIPHFDLPFRFVGKQQRTNFILNGGFEVDLTGWVIDGAPNTLTRVTSEHNFGIASAQVSSPGSPPSNYLRIITSPNVFAAQVLGQAYTASAYVKAETGQTVGKTLTLRPWDGVTPTVFSTIVLTGSWQRIACSWTAVNTNALALFIGLEGVAATGDFFGVDAVQIETGSVATDYIDTIGSPVTIPGLLSAAVSQQDSGEDVTNCVEAIVRTQAGSRMYVPLFGITDPTFSVRPLSTEQMRQEIEQNEPRANTVLRSLPDVVDQMVVNITAEVSNV